MLVHLHPEFEAAPSLPSVGWLDSRALDASPREYVRIMLRVVLLRVVLLLAAVGERLAVSDRDWTPVQDVGTMWDWFRPDNGGPTAGAPEEEVTYPKRLLRQMESEEEVLHGRLDTRVKNATTETSPLHLAQTSFQVAGFGQTFTLDLELNHHLLSSEYVERHFDEDGNARQSVGAEHCYYQGRLRGSPGSWAALSTCHGLRGMFSDGFFAYGIEPAHNGSRQEDGAHVIQRMPDIRLTPRCPEGEDRPDPTINPPPHNSSSSSSSSSSGVLRRIRRHLRRPSVQTETKYIELMVINDYELMYKEQLNTRIVLVAMETWSSENKMAVSADPLAMLAGFMVYRRDAVRQHSDATHLFSGRTFHSSRSGTAYTGGVCSPTRGGGINEYGSVGSMAVTLCQSLGQNIGMRWNNARTAAGDCRCPDAWLGCIMEDTGCLFNKPNKLLDLPECGNGFVEPGEECDCGSQVYQLRGAVCREAVNDCDIPETCTGDSSQCPHNVHKLDGYMCDSNQGRCYAGRCRTRDGQCRALWGYNSADRFCYEKLNAEGTEKGNCPSGTNIIIGSIAGAILLAAIVLGGTGWGFKNIRRGRSGGG
ncbi:hypothetical protein CRUP_004050 [Coryphaenoides rupestris]|nr:hypothetical protein CRUP_004050 [Coryphaenoides rupestris]